MFTALSLLYKLLDGVKTASHSPAQIFLLLRHDVTKEVFLLSNAVQNVNKMNTGLCPHGLPPGACPICSGMGGGGRVGERPQKAGEMSYHQCAMIGAMMRARALRLENHEKNLQARTEMALEFQQNLEKMTQKMIAFANSISNIFILKPVAYTMLNIVVGINGGINGLKNAISTVLNVIANITDKLEQIRQKFSDIQDKLNAVFGEAKAFIEKKISELVSVVKSKFEGLFKILKKHDAKDEDSKVDDDKKIFNLKTIIHKIWKKKKDDTKDKSGS